MTPTNLISSVKTGLSQARTTFDIVTAHGAQALNTGVQTLGAAKSVVVGAGNDTVAVLTRAREDLKKTFAEGVSQLGDQLVRIATPTHKEEAALRKAEVRRKNQEKRQEQAEAEAAAEATTDVSDSAAEPAAA